MKPTADEFNIACDMEPVSAFDATAHTNSEWPDEQCEKCGGTGLASSGHDIGCRLETCECQKPSLTDMLDTKLAEDEQQSSEWNGEGLPPVGTECEIRYLVEPDGGTPEWEKALVKSFYEAQVWFQDTDNLEIVMPISSCEFRPITPEQQAADERESEIYEIAQNCIRPFCEDESNGVTVKGYFPLAGAVYDWLKDTGRLTDKD